MSSSRSSSPASASSPQSSSVFQSQRGSGTSSSGFQVVSRPHNRSQSSFTASSVHSRAESSASEKHPSSPPGSGTPNQLSALGIHFQPDQQLRPLTSSPEDSKQGSSMSSPPSSGSPLPSNTNVLVTQDGDTMAKCDLGGSTGGHMIREKILAKLRIDDSEHGRCSIHRGRFLAGQEGPPLSSEDLWNGCQQMAPTGGNPPLFFVSVDGPTTGTTPLVSPGNVLYPIENKVASPEAEDTSTLGSTHLMRSARPKWHKARSSDPESSGPRSPPMLPNGAANPPNPSHLRTPSHPVPSTLSNQHASSSSPSSSSAAPRPQSPTANSLSPENHSRFGSGGRRLSEGSEAQRSAELKAVQYRVLAARKPSAEALQDSRQREYLTNPPHSSPLPESHWPSSSSGNPAFSQSTGSSSSRDGSGRDVPAWEAMQRHHQQKQARKARQDSTDEQMRPNQRLEWDHYNRNMPSQSSGLPPSSSGHHSPAHSNGLPPPPLHPMMHHQGSSSMGPAGYGASGPVFRSPHPPAQPGRYVNAGMTPAGFGPNGPTGARLGLPSSVRPAPAAPSNHSARHALQPGMKVPPQLSQQGPIPPPPQRGHPQLQPPPGRPLHAARSVDDLRHRPRPSRHDIPPMPNASRAPPLNAQSGSSSRWAQPPPMRPGTAIPTNRPSDFNGHMPFPGNSGPPMPPSPMPPPGPVNRQRPGQPARSQPNNVPASLQSGSRPQPQQQQQDPALSRHPLPVQMSPRPSQQRNADVTLSVQTDLVRSPATYELAGSAYKRSPVSGGNSAKRDAQNPFPLPASGNKPQSQDAGAGRAAPSTMELPANLRPGPSRMNAASRRQNNSSDGVLSPSSATRPINQGPPSPGGLSPAVDRPFAAPSSPTQSRFPNTRPRASSSSEVHSRSPVDATSSNSRQVSSPADARHERAGSAPAVDESYPPLPPAHVEPTAPPLWEDDLPEFSTVLASEGSTTSHNNRFSEEDQSTVKGDEWATIVRKIQENGADVDTLVPYATGPFPDDAGFATLSPVAERRTDPLAGSSSQEAAPSRGQFGCSMDDFDSDDDDERTWAVAPGTAKPKELQAIRAANAAKQESPSTPKPSLSLQIENLPSSRRAAAEASSDSPPKSRPLDPTANSEGGDDQWAVRPSVERVYDNLERFFPDHDLDKPIVDANAAPVNSPTSPPAVSAPQTTAAPTPPEPQRFRHKKSIRIIAQDRKRLLQRAESAVSRAVDGAATRASGLLRRKSTKLWGIRTEEVTPRQAKLAGTTSGPPLVAEPAPDAESASFKWMKGELIGKGSYGKVYLGFNVTTGDMLAVKQVEMPQTSSDKDNETQSNVVNALKGEINMLQDFDHVNIVQFLGYNESPEYLSIFLEYVPGGSIGRCIRKHYVATKKGFEESLIKDFTGQILSGLAYLHERGVLHRDLKADNVLVDGLGTCKISDFGISKKSDDIYNDNVEMSMQGSIFWMAPEVIDSGKRGYSAKVDVWSMGCVALEMVSGRRPFHEYQMMQALFKLGAGRMAPPVPEDVYVSSEAMEFMTRCFTILPENRPTAAELQADAFMTPVANYRFEDTSLARMLKKQ